MNAAAGGPMIWWRSCRRPDSTRVADTGYTLAMIAPVNANLSEAEIEQLADRLEANDDPDALTLEGVDGFFCALIASPRTVMPNEYLPSIFGAEESAFADLENANATMSLLMRYWNSIIADLEREAIHLPFVFDAEAGEVPGREWAQGFMAGTRLARDGWKELFVSEKEGQLFMIPLVAGEVDAHWPKEPVTPQFEENVLHSMSVGFARSYQHFANARGQQATTAYGRAVNSGADVSAHPYVRPELKVGRNDPCPCGSGKKFKKCCGATRNVPLH